MGKGERTARGGASPAARRRRQEEEGGGGRCGGRPILLKALDPSAGANYYQRAEEQGLRSGASHPGELLASGWISEESNTGRKIMGGGRAVKGGREGGREGGAAVEKSSVLFFFFILGSYSRSFSGACPHSLFSPSIPSKLRRKKNLNSKQCPGQMNKPVHTN